MSMKFYSVLLHLNFSVLTVDLASPLSVKRNGGGGGGNSISDKLGSYLPCQPTITIVAWPSWAILGYLGLPWATLGYLGLPWATLVYLGRPWASLGVLGRPWASLGVLGRPWASLGVLGRL
jgi:hypothetical protein